MQSDFEHSAPLIGQPKKGTHLSQRVCSLSHSVVSTIGSMPPDKQKYSLDAFVDIFLNGILKSELAYEFSSCFDRT